MRLAHSCLLPSVWKKAARLVLLAVGITFSAVTIAATLSMAIRQLRRFWRERREAIVRKENLSSGLFVLLIVTLAAEHWTTIARLMSNVVGVRYVHLLDAAPLHERADVYRAVAGLRGVYTGYAYVFRDGVDMVSVSGPGVSLVVNGKVSSGFG